MDVVDLGTARLVGAVKPFFFRDVIPNPEAPIVRFVLPHMLVDGQPAKQI
jgi:hypothetical protein